MTLARLLRLGLAWALGVGVSLLVSLCGAPVWPCAFCGIAAGIAGVAWREGWV